MALSEKTTIACPSGTGFTKCQSTPANWPDYLHHATLDARTIPARFPFQKPTYQHPFLVWESCSEVLSQGKPGAETVLQFAYIPLTEPLPQHAGSRAVAYPTPRLNMNWWQNGRGRWRHKQLLARLPITKAEFLATVADAARKSRQEHKTVTTDRQPMDEKRVKVDYVYGSDAPREIEATALEQGIQCQTNALDRVYRDLFQFDKPLEHVLLKNADTTGGENTRSSNVASTQVSSNIQPALDYQTVRDLDDGEDVPEASIYLVTLNHQSIDSYDSAGIWVCGDRVKGQGEKLTPSFLRKLCL